MKGTGADGARRGRLRRLGGWALVLAALLAAAVLAREPLLRGVGGFLVVEDPLERAQAIVVLAGHMPLRAMEAAELYRGGWAPRVVLVRALPGEEGRALRELGLQPPEEWELNRQVLVRLGVPASAIRVFEDEVGGTVGELQVAARGLGLDGRPVILVTSKTHTRRVRLVWNYLAGGRSRAIVRAARRDRFDPARWWRERRAARAVVREYLGLLNYWAGFPVGRAGRPPARGESALRP